MRCVYIYIYSHARFIIIIIIIIISSSSSSIMTIIITITVRQDIYNYIPETNNVSGVYSVAAVLYSQFVVHTISHDTFRIHTSVLSQLGLYA